MLSSDTEVISSMGKDLKVVNSTMNSIARTVHATSIKVGYWYNIMELVAALVDDHLVFLVKHFLKLDKVVPVP